MSIRKRKAPGRAAPRPALRKLADRVGIVGEYLDMTGKERRRTSDETRVALLAAMGIDASTETRARDAARALDEEARAALLAPACVVEVGTEAELDLALPEGARGAAEWRVELRNEDGATRVLEGKARAGGKPLAIALPRDLPMGYHELALTLRIGRAEHRAEQLLIVAPSHCPRPEDLLAGERVFGLTANLYTVRSARDWGVGDFSDLGALLEWCGEIGGAFVGVNPLHALRNEGGDISPYSPVSRLFRNPLYLDPEAVPERHEDEESGERCDARETRQALAELRASGSVEYEHVMRVKMPALELMHRAFARKHRGRDTARGRAYAAYLAEQGQPLEDFATFATIEERMRGRATTWRDWPTEYQDARSEAVREFRERHAEQVDLQRWMQFELDRQLGEAARRGRAAGLPIGIYQDLAIGTSPAGSDTWLAPDLFLPDVSIGAPPDPYSATGQNWGLPPMDPRRLRAGRYAYWISLVRATLRHAGALRIDHVMGLFQQFWIPKGMTGTGGAYVRFPADDLLGILALESTRAGALVVGEDLGTVPKHVPPAMEKWGLLSSKVLYFERTKRGGFKSSAEYPRMSLATANTHDMATLAGFWRGRDIELRRTAGLVPNARAEKREESQREKDKAALIATLRAEGALQSDVGIERDVTLRAAVHRFLRRSPAWLVGLSLDDLVGEAEPVNLPGVGPDKFPSWTRRLHTPIERLRTDPDVRRALGEERRWIPAAQPHQEPSTGEFPARASGEFSARASGELARVTGEHAARGA